MAIKYEKLVAGMKLWDVHSVRAGNTTMRRLGCWPVEIIRLVPDSRSAYVSWNGNAERWWSERSLKKLYVKIPPKLQEKLKAQRW